MTLRLAIFDVDGTLIDSLGHIMASATRAFAEVGLAPPARDEVRPLIGLSLPLVIERLCPEHPELVDRIVAGYKAAF
ncbi:MAG: HAD hydrolase-like protein, partial [Pseudomonadota bacterium]